MKENFQKGCYLKTIGQNNKKSNHHILDVYDHIHTKDGVCMTTFMDRKANKRKVQNGCYLKTIS